ncbi:MAG: ankyrin repeat domain-containing protein [Nitrospinae bacterium]|nr:ankyrin repeat domain-containing protein [Nitrospinota bacterium]
MNRSLVWLTLLCALLILSCTTAARADYGAGQAAWKAGRYAEALREWRRAARAGDSRAMAALGRAFAKGVGVPQDFVEAHKWLNLAAARGDEKAAAERDALAKEMTTEERAEARKLLRAWRTAGRRKSTAIAPRRRTPSTPRPPRRMARKVSPGNAALRAVAAGNIAALEKALAAGADPNARGGKRGWTPLMYAADKGYTLLVPPLLKAGAKPNLRAADGATALFIAALHGHSEIFAQLIRKGADVSIPGPKGKLPLEVVRDLKHMSIIALPEVVGLQQAEARKKQEAAERKMRDEAMRREREESGAFRRAQTSNTPLAYKDFLASWCPGGKFCATAHSQLDESIKKALVGKTFGGVDSDRNELRYEFFPSGKLSAVANPSSWMRGWASGTWNVDNGKVRTKLEWAGGRGWSVSEAEFNGELLTGRKQFTREGVGVFFGPKIHYITWTFKDVSPKKIGNGRSIREQSLNQTAATGGNDEVDNEGD